LLAAYEVRTRRRGKLEIEGEVRVLRAARLPGKLELLLRVLPHRLEKPVALAERVDLDQRLLDQAREHVQHVRRLELTARAHGLRRFERPSPGKDREPAQHRLLLRGEQV